jgi:5-formyltetrahydrofolate cyclo-ligase
MAVPPPPPHPDKPALRRTLRAARLDFAETAGAEALPALLARLTPLLEHAGPIAGYAAQKGEPDVLPFLKLAHARGISVALPHIGADRRMRFLVWHPEAMLIPGVLDLLQPEADGEEITPAILLVPLLGFDRAGHRLGQGGGYYDRWFAGHHQAMRVGIAWSVQELPAVPRDVWDMPLQAVATEKEWMCP